MLKVKGQFSKLFDIFSLSRFLRMEGLNGEVPFFIHHFSPKDQNEVNSETVTIKKRLSHSGIAVLEINLYDLCLELLNQEGDLDFILDSEAKSPKVELLSDVQDYLEVSNMHNMLMPKITQIMNIESFDILFITGVGLVFPYIRSHNILNNLQTVAKKKPTVMFFPGEYKHHDSTGSSLKLFGRLVDDRYYRAKDLALYEI